MIHPQIDLPEPGESEGAQRVQGNSIQCLLKTPSIDMRQPDPAKPAIARIKRQPRLHFTHGLLAASGISVHVTQEKPALCIIWVDGQRTLKQLDGLVAFTQLRV